MTQKSTAAILIGGRKTVHGAYRYRYAPFLMPACYITGYRPLALPLGELSPQVTERGLPPFLNDQINLCTHTMKIPVDIPIGESQNFQTKRRQKLRTFRIISKLLRFIMLRTIQFNDQSCRSTVKIHDESADDPLFINLHWIFAQKKIPELTFMRRHLSAKLMGIFQLAVVFGYGHCFPSPSSLRSTTSPKVRGKECSHGTLSLCLYLITRNQIIQEQAPPQFCGGANRFMCYFANRAGVKYSRREVISLSK